MQMEQCQRWIELFRYRSHTKMREPGVPALSEAVVTAPAKCLEAALDDYSLKEFLHGSHDIMYELQISAWKELKTARNGLQ